MFELGRDACNCILLFSFSFVTEREPERSGRFRCGRRTARGPAGPLDPKVRGPQASGFLLPLNRSQMLYPVLCGQRPARFKRGEVSPHPSDIISRKRLLLFRRRRAGVCSWRHFTEKLLLCPHSRAPISERARSALRPFAPRASRVRRTWSAMRKTDVFRCPPTHSPLPAGTTLSLLFSTQSQ